MFGKITEMDLQSLLNDKKFSEIRSEHPMKDSSRSETLWLTLCSSLTSVKTSFAPQMAII